MFALTACMSFKYIPIKPADYVFNDLEVVFAHMLE